MKVGWLGARESRKLKLHWLKVKVTPGQSESESLPASLIAFLILSMFATIFFHSSRDKLMPFLPGFLSPSSFK